MLNSDWQDVKVYDTFDSLAAKVNREFVKKILVK